MLPVANPTLDLHVLQLLLRIVPDLLVLLLPVLLPRDAGSEDDVLAHARGVEARSRGVALFEAELGPALALGDTGVDVFFDDGGADAAGGFDALTVVVEPVGYNGFGAVFVRGYGLGGQGRGVIEVVFDIIGPVWTADRMSERLILYSKEVCERFT